MAFRIRNTVVKKDREEKKEVEKDFEKKKEKTILNFKKIIFNFEDKRWTCKK